MVFADERARHVRRYQADKADGADEGHGGGGEQRDDDEATLAQFVNVDAEAHRVGVAEAQCGQRPGVKNDKRHADEQGGKADRDGCPACFQQVAKEPEDDLL